MKREILTMFEAKEKSINVEYLYWVGCAGSFDEKVKSTTLKFSKLLQKANISFGILGNEEKCTGDVAKRTGNEFLFQSMAFENIKILESYGVKKILTTCPHCLNTLKNEYSKLGGNYEVIFYTDFILKLIGEGSLEISKEKFSGKKITFHDPCYLGRGNGDYNSVRKLIEKSGAELIEMKKSKENSFCCGAGGGQIFKEAEKGDKEINEERIEQIKEIKVESVAVACPFCRIMLDDSVDKNINVIDILDVYS